MRRIIFCQEPMFLAQGCFAFSDGTAALYVVDDENFEGRLAEAGCEALTGDFRDPSIYQRAQIGKDDQILIQVQDELLMRDIVDNLYRLTKPPSVAVVTTNGASPSLPAGVKQISVGNLLCQDSQLKLQHSREHRNVQNLREALCEADNLLILIQHDPDPDAIASAMALRALLGRNRKTAAIGSFGKVTRPENVAMVRLLNVKIEHITVMSLSKYDAVAMVDVQPPYFSGVALPQVDAVIDHHPCVGNYDTRYRDVRAAFGATATIFVRYLQAVEAKITQRLATALYYGIKTDTLFLGRETTKADIEAFAYLYPLANHALIRRMQRPQLPLRDLDAFAYALRSRVVIGPVFFTHLGIVEREDVLPQFAEFCLHVGGVEWSVVSGIFGGNLIVSVRNVENVKSAGELVRHAFGHLGSAGGHRSMAKAVIPLASLEEAFGRLSDVEISQFIQQEVAQHLGIAAPAVSLA